MLFYFFTLIFHTWYVYTHLLPCSSLSSYSPPFFFSLSMMTQAFGFTWFAKDDEKTPSYLTNNL